MIAFQNKKTFSFNEIRLSDNTVSTVLVPSHLIEGLKKKTKEHGPGIVIYLRNLLWKFRTITHSGMIHPPKKIKTEYQEEGLDLKRVNFRVNTEDWLELGELALAFGKSRCWMFTFLLELDLLGLWEILSGFEFENAAPTKNKFRLKVSLSLRRFYPDFARSYHVRV